jgi:hypothetical protein
MEGNRHLFNCLEVRSIISSRTLYVSSRSNLRIDWHSMNYLDLFVICWNLKNEKLLSFGEHPCQVLFGFLHEYYNSNHRDVYLTVGKLMDRKLVSNTCY